MTRKLVMLITDDTELKELVELVLSEMNVTVLATADPQKAIKQLREDIRANIILVDTCTPNAAEAIYHIKASSLTYSIPVLAICYETSFRSSEECTEAQSAGLGADDVVLRPAGVIDLEEKIRKYLYGQ